MSNWQPNPTSLEQLRSIFSGVLSHEKKVRDAANNALEQIRDQPDLDYYLLYLLADDSSSHSSLRASAGVMLKNNIIKQNFTNSAPQELQQYILENILRGLLSNETLVRNITGNVITSLFQIYGINGWPQILSQLIDLVENGTSIHSQEGAMSAMAKICEDSTLALDYDYNGEIPSEFLVQKFLLFTNHPSQVVVAKCISSINQFIALSSNSVFSHFDQLLEALFKLTNSNDRNIKKNISTSFYLILDKSPENLAPHIEGITNFCLHTIVDTTTTLNNNNLEYNEEVAIEACEFLLGLATSSAADSNLIEKLLPSIIPVLVSKIVFSQQDVESFEAMDLIDDAEIEDKEEDIRPTNARNKQKVASKMEGNNYNNNADSNDNESDDEDDEEDDDITNCNLRKVSAATLDVLASTHPQHVMELVLPLLKDNISSDQWPVREASILAFGAICEATLLLAADKIPILVPFLVERLQDPQPRVRQITCWTLSRYSSWICEQAMDPNSQFGGYFLATLQAIMACGLDKKKVVQGSACSSVSSFVGNADYELLVNLVEPLLQFYSGCFKLYKKKNSLILYDSVQVFVEKMGDLISTNQDYVNLLLPSLLERWDQSVDDDKDIWPLLECMSSVAAVLGELFAPYAVSAYKRAVRIIENCINIDKMAKVDTSHTFVTPEKDFIITAIDLLDGLVQGLQSHCSELINENSSKTNLVDLLLQCLQDPVHEVRQSAFALIGDLAIYCLNPVLMPYLRPLVQCIINEINNRSEETSAVCNNSAWAFGEMALVLQHDQLAPYLGDTIPCLINLLNDENSEQTVLENAAIAIGRLGTSCSSELSECLPQFAFKWCTYMKYLEPNQEKETAFKGMTNIIMINPSGFNNNETLLMFIDCIGFYFHPSAELAQVFQKLIGGYKELIGLQNWNTIVGSLEGESQQYLRSKYNA